MKEITTPEMFRLRAYLEALSELLIDENYEIRLEARGLETSEDQSIQEIIKKVYPEARTEKAEFILCSIDQMIERINKSIGLAIASHCLPAISSLARARISGHLLALLRDCLDYDRARLIEYRPAQGVDDELWDFIYWGFTFLIYNQEQARCVIIHGSASD